MMDKGTVFVVGYVALVCSLPFLWKAYRDWYNKPRVPRKHPRKKKSLVERAIRHTTTSPKYDPTTTIMRTWEEQTASGMSMIMRQERIRRECAERLQREAEALQLGKYIPAPEVEDGKCPHPSASWVVVPHSYDKILRCDHCGAQKHFMDLTLAQTENMTDVILDTPWQEAQKPTLNATKPEVGGIPVGKPHSCDPSMRSYHGGSDVSTLNATKPKREL